MEPFDIGLDGEEIEASPAEPPKKKIYVACHLLILRAECRHRFLGVKSIRSIPRTLVDTVDTFRRPPLTPHMLSAFMG